MSVRNVTRAALAGSLTVVALLGGQAAAAPAESPRSAAEPKVLTYDSSGSAEFAEAVDSGVKVWNDSVTAVRLEKAADGAQANVRIVADDGWPRAVTTSLGNGTVYMGREAVQQGYHTTRIASHELGHILGLPDMKPGPCSSLMSGSSAGVSCTNADPDASEKAEVEENFTQGAAGSAAPQRTLVFQD
ncbi:snapalysin family zinc-dependent metalloprotease [Streptomyces sp. WMMB 322]|uniref:snapalysin family zinc-dependent metalloprotease n=1 Tax=Streptomyces sp. WMMB 322 TaxID=1286821 RepID=UPI0006E46B2C|nr:snapalysin family zinc-dependent metalloprotease [Streptomyces sp. WMMB 322]SCK16920.1 snapalysin [Streptomyces sp. WMMB 322]